MGESINTMQFGYLTLNGNASAKISSNWGLPGASISWSDGAIDGIFGAKTLSVNAGQYGAQYTFNFDTGEWQIAGGYARQIPGIHANVGASLFAGIGFGTNGLIAITKSEIGARWGEEGFRLGGVTQGSGILDLDGVLKAAADWFASNAPTFAYDRSHPYVTMAGREGTDIDVPGDLPLRISSGMD